jgi:hypothetical protein
MNKLYICGLQGVGKGFLRGLLQNHPNIIGSNQYTLPGLSLLQSEFKEHLCRDQHVLADDDLYSDQTRSLSIKIDHQCYLTYPGRVIKYISMKNDIDYWAIDSIDRDNNYNVIKSLESIASTIVDKEYSSIEEILDDIYSSYIGKQDISTKSEYLKEYFLQIPLENGINSVRRISSLIHNKKVIIITRAHISSSFMNAERLLERGYINSRKSTSLLQRITFSRYERTLYSRKYIQKYNNFMFQIEKIMQTDKDIMTVDFDNMILDPKSALASIENQLKINLSEKDNIAPEYLKKKYNDALYPRAIKHNPISILEKKHILMLEFLYKGFENIRYTEYAYVLFTYLKLICYEALVVIIKFIKIRNYN